MALESLKRVGPGNSGLHNDLPKILTELQGLNVTLLTGAAANTKIALAAIRNEDTIISAVQFAAGVPTDITGTMSIDDLRASGTLTLGSVVAGNNAVVNGKTYTFRAAGTQNALLNEISLGANANEAAANLAARINFAEGSGVVFASAAANVVTVRARAEGTGGNAITISGSTNVTASGATLAGGAASGGVRSSGNTTGNTIQLFWYNKK
jgi:hypothetical protein